MAGRVDLKDHLVVPKQAWKTTKSGLEINQIRPGNQDALTSLLKMETDWARLNNSD